MTDATPPTPVTTPPTPITLESALANMKAMVDALPEPAKTDFTDGLRYIELFAEQEVDAAITAYAHRIPLAGGLIGNAVQRALNQALESGLVAVIGPLTATPGT